MVTHGLVQVEDLVTVCCVTGLDGDVFTLRVDSDGMALVQTSRGVHNLATIALSAEACRFMLASCVDILDKLENPEAHE